MSILKNVSIDHIENVTVWELKDYSLRVKKSGDGNMYIAISEMEKTDDDVALNLDDNTALCKSSTTNHIDILIDIANKACLDQLIQALQEISDEYNDQPDRFL